MPALLLKFSALRSLDEHIDGDRHPGAASQLSQAENMPDVGMQVPPPRQGLDGGYWHFNQDVMRMISGKWPSGRCRNMLSLMKSAGNR
ncbi:hypothetical protein ASE23_18050 [Rhizobium sp. Root73]|nr:hypothetical protein ASC96_11330 [Rhizobium sp. Root1204]KQY01086.1 hypothetical protein ASD36_19500 [Rhizobium sp. Root1334]KRB96552.1 hypothetical protein ASE23_18050 [Rhizobium sp. Root73]